MNQSDKKKIINNYRDLFFRFGKGAAVGQWSEEGQLFRFEKLSTIGPLEGMSVLEIGCGIGDFYPYLNNKFGIKYTGIDIVPELIDYAKNKYPKATFISHDLIEEDLLGNYNYVFISGVFNNEIDNSTEFLLKMITKAFNLCDKALGFNFTSKYANRIDQGMAYHDPIEVLKFCIETLSKKVVISHNYERCDESVFVYR